MGRYESQRFSVLIRTTGTAYAMNVVLVSSRQIVIDDVRNIGDVQTAGGHIRGHEDFYGIVLELPESPLALRVIFVSVNRFGRKSKSGKIDRKPFNSMLRIAENQDLVEVIFGKQSGQCVYFPFIPADAYDILVHGSGRVASLDRDGYGDFQELGNKPVDLGGQCRREEKRLPFRGHKGEHPLDIGYKSHVEHPVGLIENHRLKFRQIDDFPFDEILQAAGGADDEIVSVAQISDLSVYRHASDAADGRDSETDRKTAAIILDLDSQFAGRDYDEDVFIAVRENLVQEWHEESGRFSRTGIRYADDVFTLQYVGDYLVLNGCRRDITFFENILFESFIHDKRGERMLRLEYVGLFGD